MTDDPQALTELAERIAAIAGELGIHTALIGAAALAANHYRRSTDDIDLATNIDPFEELPKLERALRAIGLRSKLLLPDSDDALGGVLRVWLREDKDGDPIDVIDIVNFYNPHRPTLTPAADGVKRALPVAPGAALRYVQLRDLVALKLYAGGRKDHSDVVELLVHNPAADLAEIRETCAPYGTGSILEALIAEAAEAR